MPGKVEIGGDVEERSSAAVKHTSELNTEKSLNLPIRILKRCNKRYAIKADEPMPRKRFDGTPGIWNVEEVGGGKDQTENAKDSR